MHRLVFWNTVNFVGFSVIHVSQGSVATYVRCGGSKFPAESVGERIFKIGYDLTKLLRKVWWLPFLEHSVLHYTQLKRSNQNIIDKMKLQNSFPPLKDGGS